ncbi:ROK family protein [Labrys okinawensis]|uniref:ROK family protein n=1 Tax=Labrys okinawensis TaxID=346911 RepID=UPI0039BCB11F
MILCFDIGGSAIKSAVAHSNSDIRLLTRTPTPLDDFEAFAAALAAHGAASPVEARGTLALSITGVVDPESGIITCANIPCIDGRPLAADLEARLGCSVTIANDADCFTLAEAVAGAGRGHRIVFGAILGTGVGGGLVIDGQIVAGAGGYAGEWGHGPIAATLVGEPPVEIPRLACGCGLAGCLDTVGGARGMERLHRHLHGADRSSADIVEAWLQGSTAAARTIECYVELVSAPLALVVNIVGAGIVPVGGGLGRVPGLVGRIDTAVRRQILRKTSAPLVVPSQSTVESGLIGAAILGLRGERRASSLD